MSDDTIREALENMIDEAAESIDRDAYLDRTTERNTRNLATRRSDLKEARAVLAALASRQSEPGTVEEEAEAEKLAIEILSDDYVCTRVWSAWGYGTMHEDDFHLAREDNDRISDAVALIAAAMREREEALEAEFARKWIDQPRAEVETSEESVIYEQPEGFGKELLSLSAPARDWVLSVCSAFDEASTRVVDQMLQYESELDAERAEKRHLNSALDAAKAEAEGLRAILPDLIDEAEDAASYAEVYRQGLPRFGAENKRRRELIDKARGLLRAEKPEVAPMIDIDDQMHIDVRCPKCSAVFAVGPIHAGRFPTPKPEGQRVVFPPVDMSRNLAANWPIEKPEGRTCER